MTGRAARTAPICTIAIPARNEAALIGRCLEAIARQTIGAERLGVIVLANNCTDETSAIARASHWPMMMTVIEQDFASGEAHAGTARRIAMQRAADHGAAVLTTDADCVPDDDWAEAMLASFASGADAVAGRVSGDWAEMQSHDRAALAIGALEWEYLALLARAEATFDPRPHDPWPRHAQECGANIAITAAMLARVGGVPALPCGEDRALLNAVEAAGGRLRHDPRPHVTASARTSGRAAGGMADALAARLMPGYRCDAQFERAETLVARLQARCAARAAWAAAPRPALGNFSVAWTTQLAARPDLQPARITPAQLPAEIAALRQLIADVSA
jgi:cellulose synthase/poly-beta-1,6-N-acetylglucosamine synthase-like glycosyltransferase